MDNKYKNFSQEHCVRLIGKVSLQKPIVVYHPAEHVDAVCGQPLGWQPLNCHVDPANISHQSVHVECTMTPSMILYPLEFSVSLDLRETLKLPYGCVMISSAMF